MTEITRVPLPPIEKNALAKFWIAAAIAVLFAIGIAWAAVPEGVKLETLRAGEGPNPTTEDVILVNYVGKLSDGSVFDEGEKTPLPLQGMIPGFTEGALQMQKGGKYKLLIPAAKGYGDQATGPIPANSDLEFEVELLDFMSAQEFQQQMQAMQQLQMMQRQMQQQGGEQAAPGQGQ